MKRTNSIVMFLLVGLAFVVTIGVLLQQPVDRLLILAAFGFLLFTVAWTGMYFRLAREMPGHALVGASFLNLPAAFGRRAGARNMFALVRLHFERHRFDLWTVLLIAGVVTLGVALVGQVVARR